MRYQLDEDLQYLEVIPCGPTMFQQILADSADKSTRNIKYRLHFGHFEFIGEMTQFDLKIYNMQQKPPKYFLKKLPTTNSYLGLHFTADHLSSTWWKVLDKFTNLRRLQIGCNLNMLDVLTQNANRIIGKFRFITTIDIEIIDNRKSIYEQKVLNFLDAYTGYDTMVWTPKGVELNSIRSRKCNGVELINSYGVKGYVHRCSDGRE